VAVIEVESLEKRYGEHAALGGVSFEVQRGEVVGFLGPNGAGKTTTMKILTGYISPSGGRATVAGHDVVTAPEQVRARLGYLPEAAPVYPEMRVEDYLEFVGRVRGLGRSERASAVARAMERTGLSPRARQTIGTLSKGYRQRVGLAQAILHEPDLLILDEPTSGLDPNQISDIRALIRELGQKKTVLLSTHILSEVQATCDRVLILHQGRLVADGPTAEVTAQERSELTHVVFGPGGVTLPREAVCEAVRAIPGVSDARVVATAESDPGEAPLLVKAPGDVRRELFQLAVDRGLVLLELRRERRDLEEVFRSLTAG